MRSLIVYGSKKGSTEYCANKLRSYINGNVDVVNINIIKDIDLNKYDTVIIGSSVYAGMFVKGIKEFIENNKVKLKDKNIGLFMCCMSNDEIVEKRSEEVV